MKYFTWNTSLLICLLVNSYSWGQTFKPGFDKEEYRELMLISVRAVNSEEYESKFPEPPNFRKIYQSPIVGLDNFWNLWVNEHKQAVINVRGTTQKPESWLENVYAAMIPAKGSIQLDSAYRFSYQFSSHPQAAVHVGWAIGTGFLARDILPKIDSLYKQGTKEFFIIGHSQGGAIAFLLNAYFRGQQEQNALPSDLRLKTYCSAAPKPGNLFFAYTYEAQNQAGWAYNVVNAADWVPQTPFSIQTTDDFSTDNPFVDAKKAIKKQKFPARLALKHVYKKLDKPTK